MHVSLWAANNTFQDTSMTVRESFEARNFSLSWRGVAIWGVIAAYLVLVVLFAWNPTPFAQGLAAIGFASALAHCTLSYGWKNTLALLAICMVVTFTMENIGSSTGLIFGHYHFEVGAQLPEIGTISVIVGGVWFGMGYFAWIVAATLLGGADRHLNERFNVIALPLVAAFVMTQWDFVMDPAEATISRASIWHDGGADFGVPLANYLGWLLTSWMFYQVFALYLARRRDVQSPRRDRALRLVAILFYAFSGLTHLTPWLMGQAGHVADAAGHIWRIQDLRERTVAVVLFTMLFTSMLAVLRLTRDEE
jgi:putative membrane protein